MNRSLQPKLLITFVCLAMLLTAVLGGLSPHASRASAKDADVPPSLTDISKPYAPEILNVIGQGFTPGGPVYLAIYDQAGRQLYEHRSMFATVALDPYRAAMLNVSGVSPVEGGTFNETFTGLCGAAAMMRAEDVVTGVWTSWMTVALNCPVSAAEIEDGLLDDSLRLPVANNSPSAAMIAGSADGAISDPPLLFDATTAAAAPGMVTIDGQGFTTGGRVYVAVYDQMGAKLYETRWIWASAAAGDNAPDMPAIVIKAPNGRFIATFARSAGANVMIRAYDATTETWSNWVVPNP
jgi:hypothetical protein